MKRALAIRNLINYNNEAHEAKCTKRGQPHALIRRSPYAVGRLRRSAREGHRAAWATAGTTSGGPIGPRLRERRPCRAQS